MDVTNNVVYWIVSIAVVDYASIKFVHSYM